MGYNTDFYKTNKAGELKYLYSMSGSDCPCYYTEVETQEQFEAATEQVKDNDAAFWPNWPCVWETSKISDDCIIVEPLDRRWFEFWKPKNPVKIWMGVHYQKYEGEFKNDNTKMWFTDIKPDFLSGKQGKDDIWDLDHLKVFTLPIMRVR